MVSGFYGSLLLVFRYPSEKRQETSRSPRFTWTVSDSALPPAREQIKKKN